MSRDAAIVLDLRRAAELIGQFVSGMDRVTFSEDAKTQSAVLHQIMLLGEAANRLSETKCGTSDARCAGAAAGPRGV
jgi:uncharacterized protein with HEPN domain